MDMKTNNLLKCCLTIFLLIRNSKCDESPSVIIVGAGVSGIAAASKLLENNITNLTILEAKNRIGGRVHTVPFGDNVVDLGAQWCHGEKGNAVFELADKYGLLGHEEIELEFYYSTGKLLDQAFMKGLEEIFQNISEYSAENISVGEYITKEYIEVIQDLYKNDSEKLELATETLDLMLQYVMASEGSFSPFDPSSASDFEFSEGNYNLNWKNRGYKTIIDILTKKYPNPEDQLPIDDKILLNKEVVEINWNDENKVEVKCGDGSVYQADHVIVTVSLGVLKHSHESLFLPSLPAEKINAIQDVGFGAVTKIFLQFSNRWWESNTYISYLFLWNEDDKKQFLNSLKPEQSWISDIGQVVVEKENPNVLLLFVVGASVPKMELLPDDVLIDGIMTVFHKFLNNVYDNITYPEAIRRHRWYADPHVLGTYSYQTIKSRLHDEPAGFVLSKPLGGARVLFAGEATHPIYYSTVHGALESGQREADRIIDLY